MLKYVNKKNIYLLLLLVICLVGGVVVPTYAMFQSSKVTDDDIVGITLSFNLNISDIEEYEEVSVAPGDAEVFNVQITNSSSSTAYYGIWYKMIEPSGINSNIKVAKFKGTRDASTSGSLSSKGVKTVTLVVVNDGESSIKLNIGVASSTKNTSDIEYLNGKKLITDTVTGLSSVAVGSYVDYTGNNGCSGNACKGQNANYVNDTNKGYCVDSSYKFTENGWRVGYKKDNSAYLISAGAPECVNTYVENRSSSTSSSTFGSYYYGKGYTFDNTTGKYTLTEVTPMAVNFDGSGAIASEGGFSVYRYTCKSSISGANCSNLYQVVNINSQSNASAYVYYNYDGAGVPNHIKHLNEVALKYCNSDYAYGGVCNKNSAWAMRASDFQNVTGKELTDTSCYYQYQSTVCGYGNNLIDNGGYYWIATPYNSTSMSAFGWAPYYRGVDSLPSTYFSGVRPILRLSSSVLVVGGSGTETDPYKIKTAKKEKTYLSSVEPGSYVAYTGNNGCSGNACKGQNANYVSSSNKGYCQSSSPQFTVNGWRVGYVKDSNAYLVSAGAPECMKTAKSGYEEVAGSTITPYNPSSALNTYGRTYSFDKTTGEYQLTGRTTANAEVGYYTCNKISASETCTEMAEIVSKSATNQLNVIWHTSKATTTSVSVEKHITNLNNQALQYCNSKYAYGGSCNNNTAWAMDTDDFQNITGRDVTTCNNGSDKEAVAACGFGNSLIDNGSTYWYASSKINSSYVDCWYSRNNGSFPADYELGLRPVIKLSQDVYITGGTGTEEDPYTIGI